MASLPMSIDVMLPEASASNASVLSEAIMRFKVKKKLSSRISLGSHGFGRRKLANQLPQASQSVAKSSSSQRRNSLMSSASDMAATGARLTAPMVS